VYVREEVIEAPFDCIRLAYKRARLPLDAEEAHVNVFGVYGKLLRVLDSERHAILTDEGLAGYGQYAIRLLWRR
jgi:hypothetical protein